MASLEATHFGPVLCIMGMIPFIQRGQRLLVGYISPNELSSTVRGTWERVGERCGAVGEGNSPREDGARGDESADDNRRSEERDREGTGAPESWPNGSPRDRDRDSGEAPELWLPVDLVASRV